MLKTVQRYRLFSEGDIVAVATSGGKDSLSLLYILNKYSKQLGIRVFGLLVDEGISGYREHTVKHALEVSKRFGLEIEIVRFSDEFGMTLDQMVEVSRKAALPYGPCTICGVLRRYLINRYARELGATKVATAHNVDDEVQVFLMNFVRAGVSSMGREGIAAVAQHRKFVQRVKPMYFCSEKESTVYAILNGLYPPFVECKYIVYSFRLPAREMINEYEACRPGSKYRLLALKTYLWLKLSRNIKHTQLKTCTICGEPASSDICKACQILSDLKKYRKVPDVG